MKSETIVAKGLAANATPEDRELAVARLELSGLVQDAITCRKSGKVLDAKTAVAVVVTLHSGATKVEGPYAPGLVESPDAIREAMAAVAAEHSSISEIRVLVGGELFAKHGARFHSLLKDKLDTTPRPQQLGLPGLDSR